ncbi:MBL fold metallo-hydrolase [Paracoccus laeviglucosivorans]|uniref:RNA processing exonuclease, beta-lactamase fold, Cft2 family n=1 Tax=Paracoccus laeviglucosivorans TaxID=1197861 RepID=A0A521BCW1_9RHOB|nr:MBL fold metallo-hydrolase [Paracoccus laeviglucosivorans]SMO44923.1 RNA processing exonuclease, beta-lactamase fold, Cft2 family [Paracoccus laeviglucosivorans]
MPELRTISGVGVKGPACFLLRMGGRNLLLDLGKGPDDAALPDISDLPPIDAILFSHGHADHTGGLDLWQRLGRPPLFATAPTIALTQEAALQTATPLEGLRDVMGLPFDMGPAGHAPGAVWMRLGGSEGLLYTGDYSAESTLFAVSDPLPAKAMILDAAYGVADVALDEQARQIADSIAFDVLFPCPAGGRGLELAAYFLDRGLPVALCPSHRDVAQKLIAHGTWLTDPDMPQRLLDRTEVLTETSPLSGIMIAAGPNAERGVAKAMAGRIATEGRGEIVFTGHLARGAPSHDLIAQGHARFMRWNVHPTLSGQQALVNAVGPRQMLAAFCAPEKLAELQAATDWPIAQGQEMRW